MHWSSWPQKLKMSFVIAIIAVYFFSNKNNDRNMLSVKTREPASFDCIHVLENFFRPQIVEADINDLWSKITNPDLLAKLDQTIYSDYMEKFLKGDQELERPEKVEHYLAMIDGIYNQLELKQNKYFFSIPTLPVDLSKGQQKRLMQHLTDLDLNHLTNEFEIHNYIGELYIILNKAPVSVIDFFKDQNSEAINQKMGRLLLENLTSYGMKSVIYRLSKNDRENIIQKVRTRIRFIINSKRWSYLNFLSIPFNFPNVANIKIDDELMEKILLEGVAPHQQELEKLLGRQNFRDNYERFKRIYNPIAGALGIYFIWDHFPEFMEHLNSSIEAKEEEKSRKLFEKMSMMAYAIEQSEKLNGANEGTQYDIKDINNRLIQRSIDNFKVKNNRNPSQDEVRMIQSLIIGN